MNKHALRGFSFGMIFAVSMIGTYFYYFEKPNHKKVDVISAKNQLQKHGYIVLTDDEYKKTEKMLADKKSSSTENQAKKEVVNQSSDTSLNNNMDEKKYHLNVVSGMGSNEIAKLLAEQKMIDNEKEFDQFLITHHYQTKIQLGIYELSNKMSYQQIADLITKSTKK